MKSGMNAKQVPKKQLDTKIEIIFDQQMADNSLEYLITKFYKKCDAP